MITFLSTLHDWIIRQRYFFNETTKLIADKQLDEICQAMTERKPDQI